MGRYLICYNNNDLPICPVMNVQISEIRMYEKSC